MKGGISMKKVQPYSPFGALLKNERKKMGFTQQNLADKTNITKSAIAAIEVGRILPSTETMEKLAEVLDISIEELSYEKKEAEDNPLRVGFVAQSVIMRQGKNWADMTEEEKKNYPRDEYNELLKVDSEDPDSTSFYSDEEETTEKNKIKLQVTLLEKFNQLTDINKKQLIEIAKVLLDNQK